MVTNLHIVTSTLLPSCVHPSTFPLDTCTSEHLFWFISFVPVNLVHLTVVSVLQQKAKEAPAAADEQPAQTSDPGLRRRRRHVDSPPLTTHRVTQGRHGNPCQAATGLPRTLKTSKEHIHEQPWWRSPLFFFFFFDVSPEPSWFFDRSSGILPSTPHHCH